MNTNEQAPECCPFCGAGKTNGVTLIGGGPRYECGTYAVYGPEKNVRDFQSPRCAATERERLTRERDEVMAAHTNALNQIGDLCMENANLLARVKRLEEAGDAILWYFRPKDTGDISFLQSEAIKQWTKAKEAKP